MWKPNDVVKENKKQAALVWVGMLLTIIGFVVWQSVSLVNKYKNPNTIFTVSDDVYPFPYTEVCFGGGDGCDWNGCVDSVVTTVYDPCDNEVSNVEAKSPENSSGCVTFILGNVDAEARECLDKTERPYMKLKIRWIANNDTGDEEEYNSRVSVYLGGELVEANTLVPYTRVERSDEQSASEVRIAQTDMTIGKSTRSYLSGSSVTNYPVLTTSTTYIVNRDQAEKYDELYSELIYSSSDDSSSGDNGGPVFGFMYLTLTLGSFSLTTLSDDNPIDMFDFIANIGGFWEILLLAWGVFFIARHNDTAPKQRARNFTKAIKRCLEEDTSPAVVEGPWRSSAVAHRVECVCQANLKEDLAHGGPRHASGHGVGGRVSMGESKV